MEDTTDTIFTYPEGFQEVAEALTFLPEEVREATLLAYLDMVTGSLV